MLKLVLCLVFALSLSPEAQGKGRYLPGDWVSYSVFRYVTSIAQDYDHVYFGTTGGVTRYDRFLRRWDAPFTTSDGLPGNWVRNLAYDPDRNEIWADTYAGAAVYQEAFGEWKWEPSFPQNLSKSDTANLTLPDLFTEFGPTTAGSDWVMDSHMDRYAITNYLRGDYDDELWVGTWGLNAGLASVRRLQFTVFSFGLFDKDVKAILVDGDQVWFGGTGSANPSAGMTRYDR